MNAPVRGIRAALFATATAMSATAQPAVTLPSLLDEMTDRASVARWPAPEYECLQASSYNRASTRRDAPGWFADQDGVGFIRTEQVNGRTEWVAMEHEGPGCITKMWTPFFYYSFGERTGPNIRIYLDGATNPVIDEGYIALTRGQGSFPAPLATPTARAGDSYLPIPFARSCKVTFTAKPFYNIINYRAYAPGTAVETFAKEQLTALAPVLAAAGRRLLEAPPVPLQATAQHALRLEPGAGEEITLPPGPAAISTLEIRLPAAATTPRTLRSTLVRARFDDEETIAAPVGDLFSCADALHPFRTWERTVTETGDLTLRWLMPYAKTATLRIENAGSERIELEVRCGVSAWRWDDRSLHFHAGWRPDEWLPGTPIRDWTFVDIRGRGIFVGDCWTVLNPTQGWWGEGDEKIYVDGAWERGFPTHFGTGTEDYYGWAGGEVPTRRDEFSVPFLANVRVGGVDGDRTRGFNICTRTRSLDAIPFKDRLRFDMEASPGTDQRRATDFLGYSAAMFWYARPGATDSARLDPAAAAKPIMSLADLAAAAHAVAAPLALKGAIEFETLKPSAHSPGLSFGPQRPAESMNPRQWSGEAHEFIAARAAGDFVEFTLSEQFAPAELAIGVTKSFDFGIARITVNGKPAADSVDLFSPEPRVERLPLGRFEPVNNAFVIRLELTGPNPKSRGARTYMGLDYVLVAAP